MILTDTCINLKLTTMLESYGGRRAQCNVNAIYLSQTGGRPPGANVFETITTVTTVFYVEQLSELSPA